jgi:D-3-phosphoglycerate dehydrogenase
MINRKYFSIMRDGATLVNCARAGIINEEDLREARRERKIYFCNDVYPKDAPGPKSVADIADLMLPHLGASTREANFNAAKRAAEQTVNYFARGITDCVVNKDIPDGLDANYQRLANLLTGIAHAYLGTQRQPVRIETSFYGNLNQYSSWMLAPITAALCPDFDPYLDAVDAEKFLSDRGIEYRNREVSNDKHYGDSITIDLFMGKNDTINKVSVRGTLTEGHLMISRINKFDRLYLAPSGYNLFVEYNDQPGVIGKIASILGENNINIIDIRAPQDTELNRSLATVKTQVPVSDELLAKIKISVGANVAFCYNCRD